jgi:hypothetical protein
MEHWPSSTRTEPRSRSVLARRMSLSPATTRGWSATSGSSDSSSSRDRRRNTRRAKRASRWGDADLTVATDGWEQKLGSDLSSAQSRGQRPQFAAIEFAAAYVSIALYGSLPASGSAGSSFFTRERSPVHSHARDRRSSRAAPGGTPAQERPVSRTPVAEAHECSHGRPRGTASTWQATRRRRLRNKWCRRRWLVETHRSRDGGVAHQQNTAAPTRTGCSGASSKSRA